MFSSEQKEYLENLKASLVDNCPKCGGTDLSCSCYSVFEASSGVVRSGIPRRYWEAKDADMIALLPAGARLKLQEYNDKIKDNIHNGLGLYIYGASSSARAIFGCLVVRHAVTTLGISAAFRTRDDFTDQIKNARVSDKEDQVISYFSTVNLFVMDNIGFVYRPNRSDMSYPDYLFGRVIKQRENSGRSTILTSDVSFMEFQADLKARHMPDLCDSPGVYDVVHMDEKHDKGSKKVTKKA